MILRLLALSCLISLAFAATDSCPNSCNSNGRCIGRQCQCFDGYTSADCSLRLCPMDAAWSDVAKGIDKAHNLAECSNMGICDRYSGTCYCRPGFTGNACERFVCTGNCKEKGKCMSIQDYAKSKDPGSGEVYSYNSRWDAEKIYGCNCDTGYSGFDCSLRDCPTGDDPLTGTGISGDPLQYNEVQKVLCLAGGGSFTLTFKGETASWISYDAKALDIQSALESLSTIGKGGIKIVMYNAQACTEVGTSWTVEFLQNFGDVPMMIPYGDKLTVSQQGATSMLRVYEQTKGNKEDDFCSNRGVCDQALGICGCSLNYDTSDGYGQIGERGDCGYPTTTIQFCPGSVSCSGHGDCLGSPTFKCICSDGWTGADCSMRVCPSDIAWFSLPEDNNVAHLSTFAECSNRGVCNRDTGSCVCDVGFIGSSCNVLTCAGDSLPCNGHGKCLSMSGLALAATVNGVAAGFTYGNTPNDPNTWDASRVYGCLCDEGYEGYDCSLYSCPTGDDPDTLGQFDEQQYITCTDEDGVGTIKLTFRQKSTEVLFPTATAAKVKAALEALSTIGTVSVETLNPDDNDELCSPDGNTFVVTFKTEHGDLPLLESSTLGLSSPLQITEHRMGTKETLVCSGRGVCDTSVGLCTCFTGYGSSDGMGGRGSLADCGYAEPITV